MREIFATDIREKKEFNRHDYHYTQIRADDENHIYLYSMERKDGKDLGYSQYELVKGKKHKNPDGSVVYTYPKDEDFGTYGWYICGPFEYCSKKIDEKWQYLQTVSPKSGLIE